MTQSLDDEITAVRAYLAALESRRNQSECHQSTQSVEACRVFGAASLNKDEVERFSRQMLCEDLGPAGTKKLRTSKVLVIGAGGLGSTVCLYLAAAGVGHLTIVDFDTVERSNLHRQVIHNESRIDMPKALSAKISCHSLNPTTNVVAITERFDASNAERLVSNCDVVVDASDNVAARYLINDAAVVCNKPLVSGSAMRWEGQLTVYHYQAETPCYRCLFPKPPPAAAVGSCNDTGVVGPVPGMIGCLQALETIKVIAGCGAPLAGSMLLWNGLTSMFKTIKLRPRQRNVCEVCGDAPRITSPLTSLCREEYEMSSCARPTAALEAKHETQPRDLFPAKRGRDDAIPADQTIIDVRDKLQYEICHLPGSVSLPLTALQQAKGARERMELLAAAISASGQSTDVKTIYVICRRGVASSVATKLLIEAQAEVRASSTPNVAHCDANVVNISGGLNRYHKEVDRDFPWY